MNTALGLLFVFVISFLLFYVVVNRVMKQKHVNRRIDEFIPSSSILEETKSLEEKQNVFRRFIVMTAKAFNGMKFVRKKEKMLQEAGSMLKPEEFFELRILIGVGAGLVSFLIGLHWLIWIIAAIAGFVAPVSYMKRKRKKRLNLLSYQLVEALGMMANSMRAGFSFMQAIQLAGKEMPDPLGTEFERVIREMGLGVSLDKAFQDMLERLPNKELEVVVQAILAQRTSGGNLAELMETMEETIRGRIRVLEELNTLIAQGKMSSWVITLLPVGLAFYLYFVSPDYFRPMLNHPLGWLMISGAVLSTIIGWIVIQKIIRIEV